jgi:hypothetical protein
LNELLLNGKTPLDLEVREFQYSGESRGSGQLIKLDGSIAQQELDDQTKRLVIEELDTQERSQQCFSMLENAISFLVTIGSSGIRGIDGNTLFATYV